MWAQLQAGGYFAGSAPLPPVLASVQAGGAGQAAAAHALGGCLSHLRDCLLDKQVGGQGRQRRAGRRGACRLAAKPASGTAADLIGGPHQLMPPSHPTCSTRSPHAAASRSQVLAAGRVELLADSFGIGAGLGGAAGGEGANGAPAYMALDGAALENLEVRWVAPPVVA